MWQCREGISKHNGISGASGGADMVLNNQYSGFTQRVGS